MTRTEFTTTQGGKVCLTAFDVKAVEEVTTKDPHTKIVYGGWYVLVKESYNEVLKKLGWKPTDLVE